jgi:peptidoglycan hydrolase-like protein with peptidoglycan-binding domain
MKLRTAVLLLILPAGMLFADPVIESVQQALKDEGFFYGDVTGNKDADTAAAIRRYQIRNGLQITGDLNDETLKALDVDSSGGRTVVQATPTTAQDTSDLKTAPNREPKSEPEPEPEQMEKPTNPMTGQQFPEPARQGQRPPSDEAVIVPRPGGNFAGTPYEASPPQAQRDVVLSAQSILARKGLYHGPVDGEVSQDLEFSLRAYQARVHVPVTGRLDLETLAALQLLPGANKPVYIPRHHTPQTPVHGEWIREH